MPTSNDSNDSKLASAFAQVGRTLGEREAPHREGLEAARATANALHARVSAALEHYHAAIQTAGSPHLRVEIGDPRLDHKHVRSYEFVLKRGRHRGLFILKSKGQLTLVGPFREGKTEGPCQRIQLPYSGSSAAASNDEVDAAIIEFVSKFLEEAATP